MSLSMPPWAGLTTSPGVFSFRENEDSNPNLTASKLSSETQESIIGASLAGQWLRICLPMQGTRVRGLVREDPTRRGATKPVRHNY